MIKHIKQWYNGKIVEDDFEKTGVSYEDAQMEVLHMRTQRHWTAKLARKVVSYAISNHQWLIGVVIAIVTIFVTILVAS